MIYIFHGPDTFKSRQAYGQLLDSKKDLNRLSLDSKTAKLENVQQFLESTNLLGDKKLLVLDNFFSVNKAIFEKLVPLLNSTETEVVIWQDKALTLTQLKSFPKANVQNFPASNLIFNCLGTIKPHNFQAFCTSYHAAIKSEPFEFLFYMLKTSLRKKLVAPWGFKVEEVKSAYLNCTLLEYQIKTGTLAIDKTVALERILAKLLL